MISNPHDALNEHVEPEGLQDLLERDLGPEAKDAIMTAGQRLIEQGPQARNPARNPGSAPAAPAAALR
jgi:hypothetical protein